jgi:hypothetical protein
MQQITFIFDNACFPGHTPFLPCSSHRNIASFITNGFKAQNISSDYEREAQESATKMQDFNPQ